MDKFLKTYNLPRLNHEEIKNLNKPITSEETERVVTTSEQRKARLLHCKISEDILCKISEDNLSFKDKLRPILKLFWKIEKEYFQTHLSGQHHPDTKSQTKMLQENYGAISLVNIIAQVLHKILANQNDTL